MIVCRHCGWDNPPEAAFCTNCGRGLARSRPGGRSSVAGGPHGSSGGSVSGEFDAGASEPGASDELPLPVLNPPPDVGEDAATLLDFRIPSDVLAELTGVPRTDEMPAAASPDASPEDAEPPGSLTSGEQRILDLGEVARALRVEAGFDRAPRATPPIVGTPGPSADRVTADDDGPVDGAAEEEAELIDLAPFAVTVPPVPVPPPDDDLLEDPLAFDLDEDGPELHGDALPETEDEEVESEDGEPVPEDWDGGADAEAEAEDAAPDAADDEVLELDAVELEPVDETPAPGDATASEAPDGDSPEGDEREAAELVPAAATPAPGGGKSSAAPEDEEPGEVGPDAAEVDPPESELDSGGTAAPDAPGESEAEGAEAVAAPEQAVEPPNAADEEVDAPVVDEADVIGEPAGTDAPSAPEDAAPDPEAPEVEAPDDPAGEDGEEAPDDPAGEDGEEAPVPPEPSESDADAGSLPEPSEPSEPSGPGGPRPLPRVIARSSPIGRVAVPIASDSMESALLPPPENPFRDTDDEGDERAPAPRPPEEDTDAFDSVDVEPISEDELESGDWVGEERAALLSDPDEPVAIADDPDGFDGVLDSIDGELSEEIEELSTSDLHAVAGVLGEAEILQSQDMEVLSGFDDEHRVVPPPLPETGRFVIRALSSNPDDSELLAIGGEAVTIGRTQGQHRQPDDPRLSPLHAQFIVEHEALAVVDLDSLNGVWLRIRGEARIEPGDVFMVGRQILRLERVEGHPDAGVVTDGTRRLGAPCARPGIRMVQLGEDGEPRDIYHVAADGCRVGRHLGEVVFTEDTFMSGTHALVQPREEGFVLRDLSSRNGTWIRIAGRETLRIGDAVMIGRTVWRVGRPVG